MPESPFISEADRNTLAAAGQLLAPLHQLKDDSEDVHHCARAAKNLLGIAAGSGRPDDWKRAYSACQALQGYIRELAEFVEDADTAADMLCRMCRNLTTCEKTRA